MAVLAGPARGEVGKETASGSAKADWAGRGWVAEDESEAEAAEERAAAAVEVEAAAAEAVWAAVKGSAVVTAAE